MEGTPSHEISASVSDGAPELVSLPFDPAKQAAILGHMVRDAVFFAQCRTKIKPDWFADPRDGKAYKSLLEFWKEHELFPTPEELVSSRWVKAEGPGVHAAIQKAIQATANYRLEVLRTELTHWLHARIYREGHLKSMALFNARRYAECYSIFQAKVDEMRSTRFDDDTAVSFSNPEAWLQQSEQQYGDGLTTGLKILDDALVPSGDSRGAGGLFKKDTTLILAPSNVGKSTFLTTVAIHNVLRGKSVLYMTHEGRPEDIREKFLCAIMGLPKHRLFELARTPDGINTLTLATKLLQEKLVYVPYNKAGMTVEDVVPIIRRRQEERSAANMGHGFDLLVSDYPAKLGSEKARGGNLAKRNLDAIVYDNYVQLALELNLHSLLAIQTNRQGSMVNRDDERLLTMEDVLESWDVMAMATTVITLNRDARAAANNRMTDYIAKSRSSETGVAVVARTNFAASLTHSDRLGGTWYRGSQNLSDQIDELLVTHNGKALPDGVGAFGSPTSSK